MQRIPEGSETATTAAAVVGPSLDELAREGARRMLVAALEAEVADYVARFGAARDERGHAEVMRNGHGRTRKVTVGAGTLEVRAPQVDDRRVVDGAKPSPDTVRAAVAQGGRVALLTEGHCCVPRYESKGALAQSPSLTSSRVLQKRASIVMVSRAFDLPRAGRRAGPTCPPATYIAARSA
jgi:hypothetical protein